MGKDEAMGATVPCSVSRISLHASLRSTAGLYLPFAGQLNRARSFDEAKVLRQRRRLRV